MTDQFAMPDALLDDHTDAAGGVPITQADARTLAGRLFSHVQREPGPCWLWFGYRRNGYGSIERSGRPIYTHRISFALHHGDLAAGAKVCHRCDTPNCVNPDHLFVGTQIDNVADMWAKGRGVNPPAHYGLDHWAARLTIEQLRKIRALREAGVPQRSVAAQFSVSQSTVWRIATRKSRGSEG